MTHFVTAATAQNTKTNATKPHTQRQAVISDRSLPELDQ